MATGLVPCACPICGKEVPFSEINAHIDAGCALPVKRARTEAGTLDGLLGRTTRAERIVSRCSDLGKVRPGLIGASEVSERFDGATARKKTSSSREPLAERQRPAELQQLLGQVAFSPGEPLRVLLEQDKLPSLILWGPPGCGKTSVATIVERRTAGLFRRLSAVSAGVKEVREVVEAAQGAWKLQHRKTILFLDECHRFNKSQQDALLPCIEAGVVIFLGATTENPSFAMNTALLSRCRVVQLQKLEQSCLEAILRRALASTELGAEVSDEAVTLIASIADGDARTALNTLDTACSAAVASFVATSAEGDGTSSGNAPELASKSMLPTQQAERNMPVVCVETIRSALQRAHVGFDRAGDQHYDCISALHKSLRGSDVDASLYWLARMLEGGEDPRYVSRRLMCAAAEDIGLADPRALEQAVAAHHVVCAVGMPECAVALAQAVAFLARAPKSTAVYRAYRKAAEAVKSEPNAPPPLCIRNAPTGLMRQLGYGAGYIYPPDAGYPRWPQAYLPEALAGRSFFDSGDRMSPELAMSADL